MLANFRLFIRHTVKFDIFQVQFVSKLGDLQMSKYKVQLSCLNNFIYNYNPYIIATCRPSIESLGLDAGTTVACRCDNRFILIASLSGKRGSISVKQMYSSVTENVYPTRRVGDAVNERGFIIHVLWRFAYAIARFVYCRVLSEITHSAHTVHLYLLYGSLNRQ